MVAWGMQFFIGGVASHPSILASEFEAYGARLSDARRPLTQAATRGGPIPTAIRKNFETQGRHSGPKWHDLERATELNRVNQGFPPGPVLDRRRGVLGLKWGAQARSNWQFHRDRAEFVSLPANVFYGHFHQEGYSNVPARPFVRLSESDVREIEQVFVRWFWRTGRRGPGHLSRIMQ